MLTLPPIVYICLEAARAAWVVPVPRLLLLDGDVVVFRPLRLLWQDFDAFGGASVGTVDDTSVPFADFYEASLPAHIRGVKGGVQLHDLERQRTGGYLATLDYIASGKAGLWIPLYGDGTLFSLLKASFSEHSYSLGCEWNRQLMGIRAAFAKNKSIQSCPRRCAILHANSKVCGTPHANGQPTLPSHPALP